jgi:CRP-like cAMP-binding protein
VSQPQQTTVRNRLLKALSPDDFALLHPHLELTKAELKQTLIAPNQPIKQLFFPESGYGSLATEAPEGSKAEAGIIGREGLIGASPVLLGADRTPHHVFVQAPGEMLAIDTAALCAAVDQSPSLRKLLLRYTQVLFVEAVQTAFVNAAHQSEVRLARWFLMCHDRVDGDELVMTHEFVSLMLGVTRSSATLAVQALEGYRLIKAKRGRLTILDRKALEEIAGAGYGLPEAEYARLIEGA